MSAEMRQLLPIQNLLIGACGSIGTSALPQLIVLLKGLVPHLEMTVVLTRNAARIVPASTFSALTRRRALCDWQDAEPGTTPHVALQEWAELFVVLYATANVLGKVANGIADDLLTTCILAATCPVVLVPSMNSHMWTKPAVKRNVARLREDGLSVLEPVAGMEVANGKESFGSIPPLRDLIAALAQQAHVSKNREMTIEK
jgi:phosphopantothenoylcysteine synthetase/decarboxylase